MVVSLLKRALMMSTPLLFGSIAEVVAERSGMMVTAIEGIFLMGAWGGFVGTYITGNAFIGILCAILAGVAAAAVYGVVCIYLKQHQVVTGTAINVLAAGICTYLQRVFFGVPTTPLKISPLPEIAIPVLSRKSLQMTITPSDTEGLSISRHLLWPSWLSRWDFRCLRHPSA